MLIRVDPTQKNTGDGSENPFYVFGVAYYVVPRSDFGTIRDQVVWHMKSQHGQSTYLVFIPNIFHTHIFPPFSVLGLMVSPWFSSLPSLYYPINQVGQRDRTRVKGTRDNDDRERERKEVQISRCG